MSTCTGDVIVDRRSLVSGGHIFTTQLYTLGRACMRGGREGGGRREGGGEGEGLGWMQGGRRKEGGRRGGEEKRRVEGGRELGLSDGSKNGCVH